nr:hypothetical protein [Tanacetum cinerariifolium]
MLNQLIATRVAEALADAVVTHAASTQEETNLRSNTSQNKACTYKEFRAVMQGNFRAKFVGDFKSLEKEADESLAKYKALELEIERLLRAVENEYAKLWNDWYKKCEECKFDKISYDEAYKDMQHKIERLQAQLGDLKGKRIDYTKTSRPQPRSNTKNDRVPSASTSSCNKNKRVKVEEHHRNLLLSKNKKHMSSACNNIKLDSQNAISKVVCAMCKQCLISVNHDVCLRNYVNGKTSRGYPDLFMVHRLGLFQAHDWKFKASHQFRLEVYGNCSLWK